MDDPKEPQWLGEFRKREVKGDKDLRRLQGLSSVRAGDIPGAADVLAIACSVVRTRVG